jgi:hypothetical protein
MRFRFLTSLPALLLLAACGGEVVVGGLDSYATSTGGAQPNAAVLTDGPLAGLAVQGTIDFIVTGFVVDAGGREERLTSGEVQARFRIEQDTVVIGQMIVPPGNYTSIRLRFRDVRVEGVTGLGIPGIPVGATITVPQGTEPIQVDIPLSIAVRSWETRAVLIDLRASQWLALADPPGLTVPQAAFRQAIRAQMLQ